GFGHGVGLPQYGARGAARAGWDARRILAYYYPGTAVERLPAREVRVVVAEGRSTLSVSRDRAWRVVGEAGGPPVALTPGAGYLLRAEGGGVSVSDAAGRRVAVFTGPVLVEATVPSPAIALNGNPYRGRIRVIPRGGVL